ncbi:MAG: MBL fold metallo-hydrolase [Methanomicrobiaceae archaeon]|nr:MBL fold metallo-hydrolase [Methanomicrobiaceae archaeon]
MKITVLCDNNTITDVYLTGEPALSFFIEESGKNILFDTGYSDVFLKNAEELGINLLLTDYIVLSHGHIDHTGGLLHLKKMYDNARKDGIFCKKPVIVAHPEIFRSVTAEGFGDIGCPLKKEEAETFADVILSNEPVRITDNIIFMGEIVEKTPFETPVSAGILRDSAGNSAPDLQPDDSALLYSGNDGLVIITGCSHRGICSIAKEAAKICGRNEFRDIIGGLHLLGADEYRLYETGKFLKNLGLKKIHPCHCTDLAAKIALSEFFEVVDVGCGLVIEF